MSSYEDLKKKIMVKYQKKDVEEKNEEKEEKTKETQKIEAPQISIPLPSSSSEKSKTIDEKQYKEPAIPSPSPLPSVPSPTLAIPPTISEKEKEKEKKEREREKVEKEKVKEETVQTSVQITRVTVAQPSILPPIAQEQKATKIETVEIPAPTEYVVSLDILKEIENWSEEDVAEPMPKLVITIFGHKGHGKTFNAMSLPGKVMIISFDRKATPIKYYFYSGDSRIKIYEPVRFMDWESSEATKRGEMVFQYVKEKLLKKVARELKPDWIVFDNVEILEQILELAMRFRYKLPKSGGIRDLNIWKEIRFMLRELHNLAYEIANYGVVYTTYVEKRTVFDKFSGEFREVEDSPHWLDIIKYETDIILRVEYDEYEQKWTVKVVSSKVSFIPTGKEYDVSNNPIGNQIDWAEFKKLIEKALQEKAHVF